MATERQYFGTDGIRGRVGDQHINPAFIMKLGWAAGKVFATEKGSKILIGKDTRISGYMFESALEAGISAAGVDSYLLGPMPTPGIAYLTRTLGAQLGIVISASHNKFEDNGIKFFDSQGNKLSDSDELAIEAWLNKDPTVVPPQQLGKAKRVKDAAARYIEFCKGTIPSSVRLNHLKIVIDCAHGATYHIAPYVFRELGAEVICIADQPNGLNINDGVGSTHPEHLQQAVLHHQADLGIAFDGDGDRVIIVNQAGQLMDGDELLWIIANDCHQTNRLNGGVIGTVMSNLGLELALQSQGIPFKRSAVGDRYVIEQLQQTGWQLGGESSGHIICLNATTTGDGIVAALQVLSAMVTQQRSLYELTSDLTKLPQLMINVPAAAPAVIANESAVMEAVKQAEQNLAGNGRILLRPSGTEPKVRVMVEGEDEQAIKQLAEQVAAVVRQVADAYEPKQNFGT